MLRLQHRSRQRAAAKQMPRNQRRNVRVDPVKLRQPSADHNRVRVQQVDHRRQRPPNASLQPRNAGPRRRGLAPPPPPNPFGPACTFPSTAIPPPPPAPRITANTSLAPAAAPSVASDTARQFASFAQRTGLPRATPKSRSSGRPFSHVELAFLTSPVAR